MKAERTHRAVELLVINHTESERLLFVGVGVARLGRTSHTEVVSVRRDVDGSKQTASREDVELGCPEQKDRRRTCTALPVPAPKKAKKSAANHARPEQPST